MKLYLLIFPVLGFFSFQLANPVQGQQPESGKIRFYNASFEDTPRASAAPAGWRSWTLGSTPDIMPGAWGVQCKPQDGTSCLALVTREDGTTEDVSQVLSSPLKKDSCYTFTLYLANSPEYVGFNLPVRLRVWGSAQPGKKEVLLASSPLVDNKEWRLYKFQFVPSRDLRSITFEAYYAPGTLFKYRGNILLDHCSPIERCYRA
ncbi:MAG: hypothetical protein IPL65_01675 [Lewinellaceae bacterium]|nr:hypothetical protein [Lewinellaceae bacterium]